MALTLKRQPERSKVCGQTCVAMLAGVDLETAKWAVGINSGTTWADLSHGLSVFGLYATKSIPLKEGELPDTSVRAIMRLRKPGSKWGGHWVVLDGGRVLDPDGGEWPNVEVYAAWLAVQGIRIASYFEVRYTEPSKEEDDA